MALTRYKIGELISVVDERNNIGIKEFYGININKEFMPTVANTDGLDEIKYKVVRKNRFVYSGMQTGRDECIRISMYNNEKPILVSPAYTTFEIVATSIVLPQYFFMRFLSKEKDRYGAFCSDGSIRSNLDWEVFCDIDIDLPPLSIQQKYVDVYNAMLENQKSYERGLDDLKLVCDAYIEDLRRKMPSEPIGPYIGESFKKNNENNYGIDFIKGISIKKEFIDTKADTNDLSTFNYKITQKGEFAFNPNTARMGEKFCIAYNDTNDDILVSAIYPVFKIKDKAKICPEYLMMFFARNEFDRYVRFNSWGSARETFNYDDICQVEIPIPEYNIQKSIVDIYKTYNTRKFINERLKTQIKDICPILIKGSIEEARRNVNVHTAV